VTSDRSTATAWDAEYHTGRYLAEPPVAVNAAGTDIWSEHEVTERNPDGGLTVRYLAGPKQGLLIHFFGAAELDKLIGSGFTPILPTRLHRTWRTPPKSGQWSQCEAIWRTAG
jgi:hypothetical protein